MAAGETNGAAIAFAFANNYVAVAVAAAVSLAATYKEMEAGCRGKLHDEDVAVGVGDRIQSRIWESVSDKFCT